MFFVGLVCGGLEGHYGGICMAVNEKMRVSTGIRIIGVYAGYRIYRPRDDSKPSKCMMSIVAGNITARLYYDPDFADVLDEHSPGELCSVIAEPFVSNNNRLAWGDAQEPSWQS